MFVERTRAGVDMWLAEKKSPSMIGLCLDAGVDPGELDDLAARSDYEWLRYAVWRIMAAAEERLFSSVTGLRDMLIRCERVVGGGTERAPDESEESWISAG